VLFTRSIEVKRSLKGWAAMPSRDLAVVTLPSGLLQIFVGEYTLWQTSATAWSPASVFLPTVGPQSLQPSAIAAASNADGRPQVWASAAVGNQVIADPIYSTYKTSTAPGAGWGAWSQFAAAPSSVFDLGAGVGPPGRMQLFATVYEPATGPLVGYGTALLKTTWEVVKDSESTWEPWQDLAPATPPLSYSSGICVVSDPGKRLQLWAVTASTDALITCYKEGPEINAPWTSWTQASQLLAGASTLCGARRPDGRVQLWCVAPFWEFLYTTIQASPPSAGIEPWELVPFPVGVPAGNAVSYVTETAVATLSDGRLQLFVTALAEPGIGPSVGAVYTQYMTSTSSSAGWSEWEAVPGTELG
jgi:hypothetical protein